MDELSEEAKLLSNNKIKNIEDLKNFENKLTINIGTLSSERESLWTKRRLSKDENEKRLLAKDIGILNTKIENLRKEVQLTKDIESRLPKIEDNLTELDYQEEQEKNKENEKSKSRKEKNK